MSLPRSIRARMAATSASKGKVKNDKPKEVAATTDPPAETGIKQIDPETGDVVKTFASIQEAVDEGYNLPNLKGAVKNGNKYKGHLWAEV